MHAILFEDPGYRDLLPLVYWRPVCRLRCGRYPIMERAAGRLGAKRVSLWVRPELAAVARARHGCSVNEPAESAALLCNQRWVPEGPPLAAPLPSVGEIDGDVAFVRCDTRLAQVLCAEAMLDSNRLAELLEPLPRVAATGWMFRYPWDLIHRNGNLLRMDWEAGEAGGAGEVHSAAHLVQPEHVHVAGGATVGPGAVIDASTGPIYVDEGAAIMPNAVISGPAYIGRNAVINPSAWIRGDASIGPGCKVGGEVAASILHALSNKQHHGFVGHSYIAEWVNLGAGTTTSNLKNTYGTVTALVNGVPVDSGQQFLGSIVGDFAKTGINQILTTGAIIGFGSSVATSRVAAKFVPSLRFITEQKDEVYDCARCLHVAAKSMTRRRVEMLAAERAHFAMLPAITRRSEGL